MVDDGQKDWVELYRSALMELDRVQLSQKIDAADRAIHHRITELALQTEGAQEHLALQDALLNLRSLKRQIE
jgi:hypothetical protein